jgi:hypothetical protein
MLSLELYRRLPKPPFPPLIRNAAHHLRQEGDETGFLTGSDECGLITGVGARSASPIVVRAQAIRAVKLAHQRAECVRSLLSLARATAVLNEVQYGAQGGSAGPERAGALSPLHVGGVLRDGSLTDERGAHARGGLGARFHKINYTNIFLGTLTDPGRPYKSGIIALLADPLPSPGCGAGLFVLAEGNSAECPIRTTEQRRSRTPLGRLRRSQR